MNLNAKWGNNILDGGWLAIPNILIDKQEELGITDDELLFIIKTMRHHESFKIHDEQISKSLNPKTLQRRRNSLKEKGYLETQVYKVQDDDGTWSTTGIIYNYQKLLIALNTLCSSDDGNSIDDSFFGLPAEQTIEEKSKSQKSTLHNTNYNTTRVEFKKFEADYKNMFGKTYRYSAEEKLLIHNASNDFIESIPYIFEYTKEHIESGDLDNTFVPRIIFFLKVDFRQMQLIEYAKNKIYEAENDKKQAEKVENYLSEERAFFKKLLEKNLTITSFTEYLKKINNRNWLYLHNGSYNIDVLREVAPLIEAMQS